MRVVFRMSAIVAALAILAGGALSGCGQRGALYLPTVPPLPARPVEQTRPPATPSPDDVKPDSETASGTVPDTSGTPLSLSTDSELRNAPASDAAASTPQPSSGTLTTQ
ncbi:LPS translocon maturation chaperone LptM [Paraburkholderia sp.]|uniref:LPS translocon maturation chaperone LptM n=1 Tax=Paraburkholderia sp. TaxID=1926495 RepID=UPI003D6EF34A